MTDRPKARCERPLCDLLRAAGLMLAAVLLAVAAGPGAAADERSAIREGEALLQLHCGRCHGIVRGQPSALKDAPEMADIAGRYPVEALAEALAEGIMTGHPEMPEFVFEPDEIAHILAYLRSLRPAR